MTQTNTWQVVVEGLAVLQMDAGACLLRARTWHDLLSWPLGSWLRFLTALVILTILVWLVVRLTARVIEDSDPDEANREMLLSMVEMHLQGDLTAEEFRSIKGQLVTRLRVGEQRSAAGTAAAVSAGRRQTEAAADRPVLQEAGGSDTPGNSSQITGSRLQPEDSSNSDQTPHVQVKSSDGDMNHQNPQGSD